MLFFFGYWTYMTIGLYDTGLGMFSIFAKILSLLRRTVF